MTFDWKMIDSIEKNNIYEMALSRSKRKTSAKKYKYILYILIFNFILYILISNAYKFPEDFIIVIEKSLSFEIIALACDTVKKYPFTPYTKFKNRNLYAKVLQCDQKHIPWAASEFTTLFSYLAGSYASSNKKMIFIHAHDISEHYSIPIMEQIGYLLDTEYFYKEDYGDVFPMYIKRPIIKTEDGYSITLYEEDYFRLAMELTQGTSMQEAFYQTINNCYIDGINQTIVTQSATFFISKKFQHYYSINDYWTFTQNIHKIISKQNNDTKYNHFIGEVIERILQIILSRRCVPHQTPDELGIAQISTCC